MENVKFNSDITLGIMAIEGVKYTPGDRLGCEAFGSVFKGSGSDKTVVGIKHQYIREDNNKMQMMSEYRIHKELSAVDKMGHVVRMIAMQEHPKSVIMIMEFAPDSLHSVLEKMNPVLVQKYFRQIIWSGISSLQPCLSLRSLFEKFIIVECNNLSITGELKIADFGRAKRLMSKDQEFPSTDCRGTPKFCAPEVCVRETVLLVKPFPLDIWSSGIVLMQLTQRSEDSWREARVQIKEYDRWDAKKKTTGSDFWSEIPQTIMNLLRKILESNVSQRATIDEIKKSPYFKKDEKEPIKRSGVATRSSGPVKRGRL